MGRPNFPTTVFPDINLSDASAVVRYSRQSFRLHHGLLIEVGDCRLSFHQHDTLDMFTRAFKNIKRIPGRASANIVEQTTAGENSLELSLELRIGS